MENKLQKLYTGLKITAGVGALTGLAYLTGGGLSSGEIKPVEIVKPNLESKWKYLVINGKAENVPGAQELYTSLKKIVGGPDARSMMWDFRNNDILKQSREQESQDMADRAAGKKVPWRGMRNHFELRKEYIDEIVGMEKEEQDALFKRIFLGNEFSSWYNEQVSEFFKDAHTLEEVVGRNKIINHITDTGYKIDFESIEEEEALEFMLNGGNRELFDKMMGVKGKDGTSVLAYGNLAGYKSNPFFQAMGNPDKMADKMAIWNQLRSLTNSVGSPFSGDSAMEYIIFGGTLEDAKKIGSMKRENGTLLIFGMELMKALNEGVSIEQILECKTRDDVWRVTDPKNYSFWQELNKNPKKKAAYILEQNRMLGGGPGPGGPASGL